MYKISGNDVWLTRGDTFVADVIATRGSEPYEPTAGDTIRFALKRKLFNADKSEYVDNEPLLVVPIAYDDMVLAIEAEATKPFGFGKYAYDIEITFEDGTVDTFIRGDFILEPEVH